MWLGDLRGQEGQSRKGLGGKNGAWGRVPMLTFGEEVGVGDSGVSTETVTTVLTAAVWLVLEPWLCSSCHGTLGRPCALSHQSPTYNNRSKCGVHHHFPQHLNPGELSGYWPCRLPVLRLLTSLFLRAAPVESLRCKLGQEQMGLTSQIEAQESKAKSHLLTG